MRLEDLASVVRSKNAGPLVLTLDVIFTDAEAFNRAAAAADRFGDEVARRYGQDRQTVRVLVYPPAMAIKVSLPRRMAGDVGDRDVYGAQQHAPLLGIEL